MSTLKFTGIAQARKRNTSYDIAVENGFVGDEQAYEIYTHGLTVAQVTLYKRATSAPNSYQTDGGTNVTYTFSNGNISFAGSDAGWHTSPYTDDGDLYVIYASASSKDTYDTILPSEWSIPAIMSEEAAQGEPGNNVCVVLIYNASANTPSLPSAEIQFTFSTGDIIGLTNGWVKSPPSGDKVWVSTAIAMSQEPSARISASAWSTPNIWKQKGDTGVGLAQPTEEYAVNNSTTTPPSSGWTTFSSAVAQLDANHRYLWNKETMNYSDGSSSPTSSYRIIYRFSTDGADAKVFDFNMSSQIFAMNLRLAGYSQIDLESIVQGYQGVNILWTVTGGTFDTTSPTPVRTSTATSPSLFIPYTTSADITITLEDTTSGSTIEPVVKTLTANDETSYGHNYGLLASEPTIASSPRLIYAPNKPTDFYTDSTDGVTYEYTMVGQTVTWNISDDANRLLDGLSLIKSADPPIDLNDPAYSNSNGVALFTTILAEKVIARVIKTLQLEVGTENSGLYVHIAESNGNKIFIVKYNGAPIFTIDSEGKTSMVKATMDNASLTGDGSSFYSDVFKTTRANSSSGTVNKDYTSLDWYYKLETMDDESLAYAFWDYVTDNGSDVRIDIPVERTGMWKAIYAEGYYNGVHFDRVFADPDVPREIGVAIIGTIDDAGNLWLEYNTARTTIVNQSVATYISGVQIDKANYKQGWLLTASFISSLNLPYNFSMRVTGGYATVNNGSQTFYSGSTLTLTSSSITLSGSGNPATLTAGTYVQPFGFYGMTVETSRDGIATKHIASYDGNTYDVGTTDKPFNFYGYVNGNASSGKSNPNNFKVWGAVFN